MHLDPRDGAARLSPDDTETIRFPMTASGRRVEVHLPIAVMRAEFGASRLAPLEQFASHRTVIEATAKQSYEALSGLGDRLEMAATDFATQASRSHSAGARKN